MSYQRTTVGTDHHVTQFYEVIIDQVMENLMPRLEEEGIDTSVLTSIKQLWREKLYMFDGAAGGAYGSSSGGQMRMPEAAMGGHAHAFATGMGYPGLDGHAMSRHAQLPHGSDVLLGHGIRVKAEGLPQTDGAGDHIESETEERARPVAYPFQCAAATAARRKPMRGDLVTLTIGGDGNSSDGLVAEAISQLDGLGAGPKRRKTNESGGYDEEGGEDDDDDGGGDGGNEEEELNSDDDDEDDDYGERTAEHFILCQFEKVTRQKQKWKGQFKDGMVRLKGRDFLFKKATGDMNFQK